LLGIPGLVLVFLTPLFFFETLALGESYRPPHQKYPEMMGSDRNLLKPL
jgi:hypothetical protein